jgi:Zn finger protein HypA/HybF involved in hydrogenase expression
MHEYGIVRDLMERIQSELAGRTVKQVRLRRGSTFAEAPLRQAFAILAAGTPLAGAALVVEEFSEQVLCGSCSTRRTITADDLIGHLFICPECGAAREIDEAHGLELLEVTLEEPPSRQAGGAG